MGECKKWNGVAAVKPHRRAQSKSASALRDAGTSHKRSDGYKEVSESRGAGGASFAISHAPAAAAATATATAIATANARDISIL
ncbi:unnamed protein product, partial [Iphiclides podalirius]